jgi:hypothetical protein
VAINIPIDAVPLPTILVVTVIVVLVAIEVGFRIGRRRRDTQSGLADSEAQLSAMTGAHLALLAFIMAFSFSMASGHYQDRRELIMADANAISTAHLRAQLIDSQEARNIQDALLEYAQVRATVKTIDDAPRMISESERLQALMWNDVQAMVKLQPPNVTHSLLIQSLNEAFDIHDLRITAALKKRVPKSLWGFLAALLILAMLGIGYFSGAKGNRNPIASTCLALSFSLVLLLIADLDRPTGGTLRADQGPMLDMLEKLQREP